MFILTYLNRISHDTIPLFILISFISFIILIYFNYKHIKKVLNKIDKKTIYILILLFLMSLMIRLFIPSHHHVMYIDEPWYMEAGKNMLLTGNQGVYPKSIGWSFILSIVFAIFGINNWVAINTSIVLGALSTLTIFFMAFIITRKKTISLIASLIFSLFPAHIRWSATAETNVASLFFISLTIFFCFLYYRNKKISSLWLSLVALAFTSQFRPENYIFPVLFLFGCFFFDKKLYKKINLRFILPWLILIILFFPDLIQVLAHHTSGNFIESDSLGQKTGSNWSIENLINNTKNYAKHIFDGKYQPFLLLPFIIIGLIYSIIKHRREALFLITWFILIYLVYFYSWPTRFEVGGEERFYMGFYLITSIFASYGIFLITKYSASKIKNFRIRKGILFGLILIILLSFIPYVISSSNMRFVKDSDLETEIPEKAERDIPDSCIIIANLPEILKSTTNLNVIELKEYLNNPQKQEKILSEYNCVLFFEDLTCFNLRDTRHLEKCEQIKNGFLLNPFISYKKHDKIYTFYKVISKK